tara:strand:- start:466 stop:1014 length:549 start_codon:yes stop_codon:yes gene_type:complete
MGTVFVDNLEPQSGTSLTLGASGDTVNLGSGGTVTNTPAFYGELPSDQVVSRDTSTKLTGMTQNEIDTDSAFDGTTFTVPSNKAGKYYIYAHVLGNFSDCGNDGEKIIINIFKNGSSVKESNYNSAANNQLISFGAFVSMTLDLSASDTIEAYITLADASANTGMKANDNHTYLGGYRLIGA